MNVWLFALRRGLAWHHLAPEGRFTLCGRPAYAHGHIVTIDEAKQYQASECRTCRGDQPRWKNPELRRAS